MSGSFFQFVPQGKVTIRNDDCLLFVALGIGNRHLVFGVGTFQITFVNPLFKPQAAPLSPHL